MNRDRMLLGMGLALVVAVLASSYVYRQLKQNQPGKTPRQVPVVVATGPLALGQQLTASDIAVLNWPEGMRPAGSLSRPEDCIGRAVMVPLVQNEIILDQELARPEAGAGLPVTIPAGMRAVAVGVDDIVAVAGFVTPGTIVDVMVTGAGQSGPVTRTILEHTKVLAVGQELQTESGKPHSAPVVTLLVDPADAQKLTLAASNGRIHLALRNAVDMADVNPAPIYGYSMFLGGTPPALAASRPVSRQIVKAPPVAAAFTMQVIRGSKVENQSFPQ